MIDKNEEAGDNQASDAEAKTTIFNEDDPPKEQWATCQVIEDAKVVETFKVPFTQEEFNLIMLLRQKRNNPGLLKGYADGGPEREYMIAMQIPNQYGLKNRKQAIAMLRQTAKNIDQIFREGRFTPGLNSREPIAEIREALKPLIE